MVSPCEIRRSRIGCGASRGITRRIPHTVNAQRALGGTRVMVFRDLQPPAVLRSGHRDGFRSAWQPDRPVLGEWARIHATHHVRCRDRGVGCGRRHARRAPGPARRASRDRGRRAPREHADRLQYPRDAVRLPEPAHTHHEARQARLRFRAHPRRGREDHALERRGTPVQPARFQGAVVRRGRRGLAHRLHGPRAVLRHRRTRGRCLRESRPPRGPARRHLPAAGADEVQRPDRAARGAEAGRRSDSREEGHAVRVHADPPRLPLLRELHGGL